MTRIYQSTTSKAQITKMECCNTIDQIEIYEAPVVLINVRRCLWECNLASVSPFI